MELYPSAAVFGIIETVGVASESVHVSERCRNTAWRHGDRYLMQSLRKESPEVPVGVCRTHSGARIALDGMVQVRELQWPVSV